MGRLQSSSYTDRDGRQRTSVELVVLHSESAQLPRKGDAEPAAGHVASRDTAARPPTERSFLRRDGAAILAISTVPAKRNAPCGPLPHRSQGGRVEVRGGDDSEE